MHRKQEQLINTLYTKYARKIRDWAYRHTGNINIAEDIMQETFLILLIKIDEVIEHEDPRKWLFRTAKNVLLHAYHGGSVTYTGASSGQYRAKISFYAASSSESDSKSLTTNKITIS